MMMIEPITRTAARARRIPAGFSATHMYVPSSRFIALTITSRLRPLKLARPTAYRFIITMISGVAWVIGDRGGLQFCRPSPPPKKKGRELPRYAYNDRHAQCNKIVTPALLFKTRPFL